MKEKAILAGPCIGEFYWEAGRFVPHVIWKKKVQYKDENPKLIVFTRPDRYDLYGLHADKGFKFIITDEDKFNQNGYRLDNFEFERYSQMIEIFRNQCSDYEIIDHIFPDISKAQFCNRDQYSKKEMVYDYQPRYENGKKVAEYLGEYNPLVVLAPRFRNNLKRNWPYWQKFYDLIRKSNIWTEFTFIICGNKGSYIPDEKDRFLDINKIQSEGFTSLSGLLIEILRNSVLTVGSQSAIPNISLLLKTEVLEWGHQRLYHTVDYNPFNTPITFIDDYPYDLKPEIIFEEMQRILKEKNQ